MNKQYSLTEILDWMWQVELQNNKADSKPLDDYKDSEFLQEDF